MKIIIPMAGHSRRFMRSGFVDPKPFIMLDGKIMIERVCQMFSPRDEFILICNNEHLKNEKYLKMLKEIPYSCKIVGIEPHDLGPVYSALQAEAHINDPNESIILCYCDFTMQWNYKRFLMRAGLCDGVIVVFKGFQPASFGDTYYAYVKASDQMELVELREKQSFTTNRSEEFASSGVYYLDSWKTFKKYASELLAAKERVAAEYYCSLIYNYLVRDGKKVALYEAEKFICWGTPEDFAEYSFWSEYFALAANKVMAKELM